MSPGFRMVDIIGFHSFDGNVFIKCSNFTHCQPPLTVSYSWLYCGRQFRTHDDYVETKIQFTASTNIRLSFKNLKYSSSNFCSCFQVKTTKLIFKLFIFFKDNGGCEQYCKNIPGSFNCTCEEDFEVSKDGKSCDGNIIKAFSESSKSPKWTHFCIDVLVNHL